MTAQKATDVHRLLLEVDTNSQMLRIAERAAGAAAGVPATCWPEAAVKATIF